VHHLLTGYMKDVPAPGEPAYESKWGVSVGGYAVGAESEVSPANVGAYLPPGGAIGMQAHYTPFGKEVVDHSKIALYFYKEGEKPKMVLHNSVVVDNTIVIPAGEARHREIAYLEFPHDAVLYSAFPHAHYRGYASDLWIEYPDGSKKMLLSMPRYDFNWQREYTFADPVKVPAGSKLVAHYWYDNSKRNPANPDPTKEVVWGDQSFEEMFFTQLRYRWVDETAAKQTDYDEQMLKGRLIGMMDANLDDKIQIDELKGGLGDAIRPRYALADANKDGGIDQREFEPILQMMGNGRRSRAPAAGKVAAK
jgi:hypothetical protein